MERSAELRDIVLGIYHDWSQGDTSFLDRLFSTSDDVIEIGTDPEEFYVGGRPSREIWRRQIQETGGRQITPGEMWSYVEGSVGWVVDNPAFGGWAGRSRFTWLFHKEAGAWKLIHLHASVGRSNVELFGYEVTTSLDAVADLVERDRPSLVPLSSLDGTLTIMFTDIEASTSTNEEMGDDRFVPLLLKHHDIVRTKTESAGGSVVKSQGDGFMLVFPSARRAVECAVAIQQDVAEADLRLKVRMGLHTGEPARHEDDFYGRDVAYAARIGAVAMGGEILTSALVKSLVAPAQSIRFSDPRDLGLKGFEGRQQIFEVLWR